MKQYAWPLAISVALNGAIFFGADRGFFHFEKQLFEHQKRQIQSKKAEEILRFEFIEAPPKIEPQVPQKTQRQSDRDSFSRDLTEDKTLAEDFPKTKNEGPSDQLEQLKADAAAVQPEEPRQNQEPKQESESWSSQPKQNPQEEVVKQATMTFQGLIGQDKITTQEMGKKKSSGAKVMGPTSFEAMGSDMGQYMKRLKEKIWLVWFPHLAYKYPADFAGADVVLSITINAAGQVTILRILKSGGDSLFGAYCMEAVQRAAPFGEIPKDILALIGRDEIEIKFGFHYR